jgi:hypothetical protein
MPFRVQSVDGSFETVLHLDKTSGRDILVRAAAKKFRGISDLSNRESMDVARNSEYTWYDDKSGTQASSIVQQLLL